MKPKYIRILNWDKYQARTDKELPWCKLWGRLFDMPWFQDLPQSDRFIVIALLDLARKFNNNLTEELIFKGYLNRNYAILSSREELLKLCKLLQQNKFLSDQAVGLEGDKSRVDIDIAKKHSGEGENPSQTDQVFNHFLDRFKARKKVAYVPSYGKDKKIIKDLLRNDDLTPENLKNLIDLFFSSNDQFITKTDYSVGVFKSQINKLRSEGKPKREGMEYVEGVGYVRA